MTLGDDVRRAKEEELWRSFIRGMDDALLSKDHQTPARWHWCEIHDRELDVNCGYYSRCSLCMKEELDGRQADERKERGP